MASNHILPSQEHLTQETNDTLDVIKWPYTREKDVFDKECVFWLSVRNTSEAFITHEEFSELLPLVYLRRH